jgi:hypothetical protein
MDMDDDVQENETSGAETIEGHETSDSIVLGSGRRSRRKSHTVMPRLVLDSKDGKIVIKPTCGT